MTPDASISGNRNLLDLAGSLGRKKFVNVSHCQAIMDRWWRGKDYAIDPVGTYALDARFSYSATLVMILLPFLNVKLFAPLWGHAEKVQKTTKLKVEVWAIMAKGNNIRRFEKEKAREAQLNDGDERSSLGEEPSSPAQRPKLVRNSTMTKFLGSGGGLLKPDGMDDEEEDLGALGETMSLTASFYSIPAVKFMSRAVVRALFMVIYTILVSEDIVQCIDFADYCETEALARKSLSKIEIIWLLRLASFLTSSTSRTRQGGHHACSGAWATPSFLLLWCFGRSLCGFQTMAALASMNTLPTSATMPSRS